MHFPLLNHIELYCHHVTCILLPSINFQSGHSLPYVVYPFCSHLIQSTCCWQMLKRTELSALLLLLLKVVYIYSSKLAAQFQSMEVRNSNFAAFIDMFTSNTYVMVIMSDPGIRKFYACVDLLLSSQIYFVQLNTKSCQKRNAQFQLPSPSKQPHWECTQYTVPLGTPFRCQTRFQGIVSSVSFSSWETV